jgi:hypothetical protein
MALTAKATFAALQQGNVLAPEATAAPIARAADFQPLDKRASDTCGYWSFTDGFSAFQCGDFCTTSGSHHGCNDVWATTCYSEGAAQCSGSNSASLGSLDWCCDSGFPNCVTASMNVDDEWLTAYECWTGLSGDYTVYTDTRDADETATSESSSSATTTDAQTTETNGDGNDDDSGGAPVGAIVGGVVGGVALLALLGFIFWFVRFQNKKKAAAAAAGSPSAGQPPMAQGPPPPPGPQQSFGPGSAYQDPSYQGTPYQNTPSPYQNTPSPYQGTPQSYQANQYHNPHGIPPQFAGAPGYPQQGYYAPGYPQDPKMAAHNTPPPQHAHSPPQNQPIYEAPATNERNPVELQ